MAVEAPEKEPFPVEIEAVRAKLRRAEAEADARNVRDAPAAHKAHLERIELRTPDAPRLRAGNGEYGVRALAFCKAARAVEYPQPDLAPAADRGPDLGHAGRGGDDVYILYIVRLLYIQPRLAVQPAVGEIVDHEAEGRHLRVLRAVEPHGDAVLPAGDDERAYIRRERRVAAAVGEQLRAVYEQRGDVRRTVKAYKNTLSRIRCRDIQRAPVAADRFVMLRERVMERDLPDRVGEADRFVFARAEREIVGPARRELPAAAKTYQGGTSVNEIIAKP